MDKDYCLVLSTCPAGDTAESLACFLIECKLAACVNILPSVTSVYLWHGQLETGQEQLLLIKTERTLYPALEAALRERHPYALPEIIAVDIRQGSADYLNWISQCLHTESPN